jgi:hypothetical protein
VCDLGFAVVFNQALALGEALAAALPPPLDIAVGLLVPGYAEVVADAVIKAGGC